MAENGQKRILVTGGAGFIGSHVVDAYLKAGYAVAILDDFSSGKSENLPPGIGIYRGSILDPTLVMRAFQDFQPEFVNHHAAQVSVSVSVREAKMDADRNILGTINLLDAAIALPLRPKFIYATSGGAMYGDPAEIPLLETSRAEPVSPYGLSKHTAERYVWLYNQTYDLPATVLRYANVYGPRQDPHGEAGVCAIFTDRMLIDQPVSIFGDGTQQRDYVFVADVARASLSALERGGGQSYNISTSTGTTTQEVYEAIREATGYARDPQYLPARTGDLQISILSNQKARQELGWVPVTGFKEGISQTVAWAKQRAA